MRAITMTSGRTGHWTKMHQSLVKFSQSEASNHTPSLADFTTTTPELKFSVLTALLSRVSCLNVGARPKEDQMVTSVRQMLETANAAVPKMMPIAFCPVKLDLINHTFEARTRDELEHAFDKMARSGMQAVTINSEGLAFQHKEFIAKLATARRLPLSVWSRETLEAGALMSYGPDQVAICRRAAVFVDKILKGAKPAQLPVEEPTKVEFLINLKTARALGISIPSELLSTADEVIE